MKRVLLYVFILGCLATCSHLSLVPAKGYKGGSSYNSIDTCLKKENFQMMGGWGLNIKKGVEGSYNVYMSELDPLDSIQLISVCFIDETTQDTLPLKKEYFVVHDRVIMCLDSIQSTPLVIKLDPNKVDSSNKNKDMRVHIEFYPNLTKKQKKHTFSISYHIKVNEEDIIINNRKLIIIRFTHGFRNLYDYFLWPFYLIC